MGKALSETSIFLAAFAVAALLSFVLTFLFIRLGYRYQLLDYPTERKAHLKPVPFLGGLTVFISFWSLVYSAIGAAFFFKIHLYLSGGIDLWQRTLVLAPKITAVFFGSLIILLVGLFDDKYTWSPLKKLGGQMLAAFILMSFGLTINLFQGLGVLGFLITFVWILLMINAFNFIDSLDGHCTGVAVISAIMFLCISQIIHQFVMSVFLAVFAGTLLGFLPHNFKPAKIFLGDSGSLYIGYMMAAFTLLCNYQTPQTTYATLFIPVLVFGVPIYDTFSVITVRLLRGVAPWQGDRNHFAHRLVKIGMSYRAAVIFSYFISWTTGLLAILMTQVRGFGAALIGVIFVSILAVIAFLEFYAAETIRLMEMLASRKKRRRSDVREYRETHGS